MCDLEAECRTTVKCVVFSGIFSEGPRVHSSIKFELSGFRSIPMFHGDEVVVRSAWPLPPSYYHKTSSRVLPPRPPPLSPSLGAEVPLAASGSNYAVYDTPLDEVCPFPFPPSLIADVREPEQSHPRRASSPRSCPSSSSPCAGEINSRTICAARYRPSRCPCCLSSSG